MIGCCIGLFILALKRHRNGDSHMWHGPVTSCAWFNDYSKKGQTSRPRPRQQPSALPTQAPPPPPPPMRQVKNETYTPTPAKRERSTKKREYGEVPRRNHSSRSQGQSRPHRDRSHRSRGDSRGRVFSGSSLIGSTSDEYDTGMMANPNRLPPGPRGTN